MENEEIKTLLKRNLETSQEILKVVKKLHRTQKLNRFLKILKWLVIIGITIGSYYYFQPTINKFFENLQKISTDISELKNFGQSLDNLPAPINPNIPSNILKNLKDNIFLPK